MPRLGGRSPYDAPPDPSAPPRPQPLPERGEAIPGLAKRFEAKRSVGRSPGSGSAVALGSLCVLLCSSGFLVLFFCMFKLDVT